jgi:hypothetical protein
MNAEDGVTLAAAQARYFSGMTAGITAVLTPIILTPCLALAFLLTIGRASHRAVAIFFVLAIPTFVGLNLISGAVSNQQTGGIAWGSAMLSGPLVYSIMLLVREKRTGSRA